MGAPVVHFEIIGTDPQQLHRYYGDLFGWEFDTSGAVGLTSIGSFTTSFKRMFGTTPTAYRAAFPPASTFARVPACVVRAYSRPQLRTFREDDRPGRTLTSGVPTTDSGGHHVQDRQRPALGA
jgi:hypothetical protein